MRIVRWLAEVGTDLPEEARQRLLAMFYTSVGPLVLGAVNSIAVALVAAWRGDSPILYGIAAADTLLLLVRIHALRSAGRPSDLLFLTGLGWATLQGMTVGLVVASGDTAMIAVSLATSLAAIGGITGRNFAAPRYAMTQVIAIDLSFKVSFLVTNWEFAPLLVLQTPLFVLLNIGLIRQQRRTTIRAVLGDIESRAQASTDPLTRLLNRRGLADAFERAIGRNETPALLSIDLDGFKQVNDRLGHGAGDALLEQIAGRLREACGPDHAICRLGGDEFLVLAPLAEVGALRDFGTHLVLVLGTPYRLDETVLARVGASVGAVPWHAARPTLPAMMSLADEALYAAKSSGKGRCVVFDSTGPCWAKAGSDPDGGRTQGQGLTGGASLAKSAAGRLVAAMANLITDVPGVLVGQAHDPALASGVTVALFDPPATAGVFVPGGAPGGRGHEPLAPDRTVERVDALVLSGGSSFGLDSATGVDAWLRARGRGLPVRSVRVPIVASAILFDLLNGGDKDWGRYPPYRELAWEACEAAGSAVALGTAGAGYGATTVDVKGGLGSASAVSTTGATVGALVVVNAIGSALVGDGPHFWAAPFEREAEFGGLGWPASREPAQAAPRWKGGSQPATTIAIVATDATFDKGAARRLAIMASAGFARALRVTFAPADGDTIFAASTRRRPKGQDNLTELGSLAADCLARAIARGVFEARALPFRQAQHAWQDRFAVTAG